MTADTRSMDERLLPCPFCGGGEVKVARDPTAYIGGFDAIVLCKKCGANGANCKTLEEAAAAWNRRTQSEGAVRTEGVDTLADKINAAFDARIGQRPHEHTPSILVRSQRRELAEIAAKAVATSLPQHAQSGVVEDGEFQWTLEAARKFILGEDEVGGPNCGPRSLSCFKWLLRFIYDLRALATPSTPAPVAESELRDSQLLEMAADVWINMARPVTRQSDRWVTVMHEHQWLGPYAVALLRAAMSRLRPQTEKP